MASALYLRNGNIVNEGIVFKGGLVIENEKITDVIDYTSNQSEPFDIKTINLAGMHVFPGIIDSHVHFREPGMTHKGNIYSESKAAVAGGVTSIMDMPNTKPQTTSIDRIEEKIRIAEKKSLVNYAFYLGATNENLKELLAADPTYICGIKVFLGASTGNMLLNNSKSLQNIFAKVKKLITIHCEDEEIIKKNLSIAIEKYGDNIPMHFHPIIRSSEACYKSSFKALSLALKYQTRLHLLHVSTKKETELFQNIPLDTGKQITGEACVHHLWFSDNDYNEKQSLIKWNPAIKKPSDSEALLKGVNTNKIDIISTDHAPHSFEEKKQPYLSCPSGAPMIQHSLPAMLDLYHKKLISLETITEKMCHNPAKVFNIKERGFIRKGYYADLAIVDLNSQCKVNKNNVLYKCKWSPLTGHTFNSKVIHTFVNGQHVYNNTVINESKKGKLIYFSK